MKVNSESLLQTTNFENRKNRWKNSIEKFDNDLKKLKTQRKESLLEIWNMAKERIKRINKLLNKEILTVIYTDRKPLLVLENELFIKKDTKIYVTISSLTKEIKSLIQDEIMMFQEFKKTYKLEKEDIDEQIYNTVYITTSLIIFILFTLIGLISIFTTKISRIEKKLINTQNRLSENLLEIKDSKILLQNIIDSIPAAIFWKDTKNRYLGVNKYILNNAGFKKQEEMIGKTDHEMPWKDTEAEVFIADDKAIIESGKAKLQIEEELTQKNGTTIEVITSKVPLKNSKNEIIGILGIFMDITEKKEMEKMLTQKNQMLTQQSKMAALGEMLENIAHQWKQPLSLILSTTTGIKLKKEFNQLDDDFLFESIENIINSVEHMNQTMNDFRDYFQVDKAPRYFNFEKVVDKALLLVQSKLKNHSIEVIKNISAKDIYGLENEFIQVLMNILSNSIYILEKEESENRFIFIESKELKEPSKYIEIKIYDNAGGIQKEIIDKVFDAHFTTKGEEGTGIGLYMSEQIICNHMKGLIKVSNKEFTYKNIECKGAEFTITIPSEKYN
jgi:PAS domain S-box-containing protein